MKHVPERTCIGCRTKRPQAELLRLVATADPVGVRIDDRKRQPGRGAYLCRDQRCAESGVRRGLDRALRLTVPAAARQELLRAF